MEGHLSDEGILLLLDRELPRDETEAMREHLANCTSCSARLAAKQKTMSAVADIFAARKTSPSAMLRLHLRQQLVERSEPAHGWGWLGSLPYGLAAACLLASVAFVFSGRLHRHEAHAVVEAGSVPNFALTPGAIRPVELEDICPVAAKDDDDLDPAVPASMRSAVFEEYGIAAKEPETKYQIDYLVNPQLGGTNDIRNLWPQAYGNGVWNAQAKDRLEERLHQMVCARTIDLTTAQRAITTDWIAAYKKYVGPAEPRA